jgi:hypothetical protein
LTCKIIKIKRPLTAQTLFHSHYQTAKKNSANLTPAFSQTVKINLKKDFESLSRTWGAEHLMMFSLMYSSPIFALLNNTLLM